MWAVLTRCFACCQPRQAADPFGSDWDYSGSHGTTDSESLLRRDMFVRSSSTSSTSSSEQSRLVPITPSPERPTSHDHS